MATSGSHDVGSVSKLFAALTALALGAVAVLLPYWHLVGNLWHP